VAYLYLESTVQKCFQRFPEPGTISRVITAKPQGSSEFAGLEIVGHRHYLTSALSSRCLWACLSTCSGVMTSVKARAPGGLLYIRSPLGCKDQHRHGWRPVANSAMAVKTVLRCVEGRDQQYDIGMVLIDPIPSYRWSSLHRSPQVAYNHQPLGKWRSLSTINNLHPCLKSWHLETGFSGGSIFLAVRLPPVQWL